MTKFQPYNPYEVDMHFWHETPERILELCNSGILSRVNVNRAMINGKIVNYTLCGRDINSYENLVEGRDVIYLGVGRIYTGE